MLLESLARLRMSRLAEGSVLRRSVMMSTPATGAAAQMSTEHS
jgi:hypothetical protein